MSQTPESNILEACCEYLEVKRHIFWRQNTTPVYDPVKQTFRRMPKFSRKGVSDIIILKDSRAFFVEVKAPKGYQSPEQKEFQQLVESAGSVYLVVRHPDDLEKAGF